MEQLDKAIEALTKLRIQAVKESNNDLEQKLYEVEMLIFKTYDNSGNLLVMPSLHEFKARRQKLRLPLREVANKTKVSAATISRIENGHEADYTNVKSLHEWYASNGA